MWTPITYPETLPLKTATFLFWSRWFHSFRWVRACQMVKCSSCSIEVWCSPSGLSCYICLKIGYLSFWLNIDLSCKLDPTQLFIGWIHHNKNPWHVLFPWFSHENLNLVGHIKLYPMKIRIEHPHIPIWFVISCYIPFLSTHIHSKGDKIW